MIDKSIESNDRLNAAFNSGSVLTANLDELKRLLADTAMVYTKNPKLVEITPRRAELIKQLIDIRQKSEEFAATRRRSTWALIIAIGSLLIAGGKLAFDVISASSSRSTVPPQSVASPR